MSISIDFLKYQKDIKFKTINEKTYVFDPIRKKYLRLLPEELVRQLCLQYLIREKEYSPSLLKVEKELKYKSHTRRYDILAVSKNNENFLLIECKSPNVPLNQSVLDQIAQYNLKLEVPYLFITNGIDNYCFKFDNKLNKYYTIKEIPSFI